MIERGRRRRVLKGNSRAAQPFIRASAAHGANAVFPESHTMKVMNKMQILCGIALLYSTDPVFVDVPEPDLEGTEISELNLLV